METLVDETDRYITDLVKVLNSPIEDDFSDKLVARIGRPRFVRYAALLIAGLTGLSISIAPITQLIVAASDRLIGAPAVIPEMASGYGFPLSVPVCVLGICWAAFLRRLNSPPKTLDSRTPPS